MLDDNKKKPEGSAGGEASVDDTSTDDTGMDYDDTSEDTSTAQ